MTQQPNHKPGDVVNGHRLGEDLIWHPVEQQAPATPAAQDGPLGWVGRHKVLSGILAAVLFLGFIGAMSGVSGGGEGDGGSTATADTASPSATPTGSISPRRPRSWRGRSPRPAGRQASGCSSPPSASLGNPGGEPAVPSTRESKIPESPQICI